MFVEVATLQFAADHYDTHISAVVGTRVRFCFTSDVWHTSYGSAAGWDVVVVLQCSVPHCDITACGVLVVLQHCCDYASSDYGVCATDCIRYAVTGGTVPHSVLSSVCSGVLQSPFRMESLQEDSTAQRLLWQ